jgi:hypothetical protein
LSKNIGHNYEVVTVNIRTVWLVSAFVPVALALFSSAAAQDVATSPQLQPLAEEVANRFDQALLEIAAQNEDIASLESRAARREGVIADLLSTRRDGLWTSMFQNTVTLANEVAAQRAANRDVSVYWGQLASKLSELPDQMQGALQRVRERAIFPSSDLAPQDFVVADQGLFKVIHDQSNLFKALIDYFETADAFGIDASN